ncbi:MAG: heavy metal translocating P-type ATPase [Chloroflexi bacterium]|nr:heavy metal translocating P-type ATPase [Chloroflexota bacterium]
MTPKNKHEHSHEGHNMASEHNHEGHTMAAEDSHSNHAGMEHQGHDSGHGEHGGHAHADHTGHELLFRNRFWISLALSIPVLMYSPSVQRWLSFTAPSFPGSQWITPIFATIVFIVGGIPFIQMAIPELKNRKPGMMMLITLAISVAFIYSIAALIIAPESGFFWELVTLIDVMLLGHWFEMRSIRQASGALNELAKLMPDQAERILPDGSTETVSTSVLKTGDLLLVRPGASIPADGEVVEGSSDVNEAMITGESKPVKKTPGDPLIAGTINGQGSLRIRVTATGDDTALAGIMRLVEQAQQSKSPTQVLADKAAGWLFYVALISAILTGIFWTIGYGFNVEVISRVATILVIACPHALGLAVPLVVAISTSLAARNGILVRDRLALENARNLNTIIFDKTGTLTKGEQGVVGIATVDGWDEDKAVALAAAIEGDSEHIIAQAIRTVASEREVSIPKIDEFEAIKGRGVKVRYNDGTAYVGGPRLLELLNLTPSPELSTFAREAGEKAQSVIYLVAENQVVAAFALADVIREESRQAVIRLHEMGVEVAMLTGDSKEVAAAVAKELGIDTYFAEVLPEDKDKRVAELQAQGKLVAMVGDGVNDAPALTRADVGIAIGGGTDVAIESADIILVRSNPLDVVKVIELSRATHRKMVQNLWWAAGYNIFVIPLAAVSVLITPAIGALFMAASTIIVAINAQTLRRTELA